MVTVFQSKENVFNNLLKPMLQHMATTWHASFGSLHVELLTLHLTLQPVIRNVRKSCRNVCD